VLREPEFLIERSQRRDVAAAIAKRVRVEHDVDVRPQGDELSTEPRRVLVFGELLAEGLSLDLVQVLVDPVQAAELYEEVPRGLRADRRHARDVVRRVAREREPVANQSRRHAEPLQDFRRSEDLVSHRVPHQHVVSDELHQVLVGADDHDAERTLSRLRHGGGDEIVGFEAVLLEHGDRERIDELTASRHLLRQIGWWRWAMSFVLGVDLFSECRRAGIHCDREHRGAALAHEPLEHVHRSEHGLRRFSGGSGEGSYRVVGAKDVAREIHDVEDVEGARLEQRRRHGIRLVPSSGSDRRASGGGTSGPAPIPWRDALNAQVHDMNK
jgi:hypothetical protein